MDIAQIDSAVLSTARNRWTKVAMVIARAADAMSDDSMPADERCEAISRRIEALVQDGRLTAKGNTKNWRSSEIRVPPN